MNSTIIFIENLKHHFQVNSLRMLAEKIDYSKSIVLNWSSGRSSPNIQQLDNIAYQIGIEVSELLIEKNTFTIETPVWRDKINITLIKNLGRLRLERGIRENFFNKYITDEYNMNYRVFLRYVNGENSRINLVTLDKLAKILNVKISKLLKKEITK